MGFFVLLLRLRLWNPYYGNIYLLKLLSQY